MKKKKLKKKLKKATRAWHFWFKQHQKQSKELKKIEEFADHAFDAGYTAARIMPPFPGGLLGSIFAGNPRRPPEDNTLDAETLEPKDEGENGKKN